MGCSYADFFPVLLDCSDELADADSVDDFCASECRDVLESFEADCNGLIPHQVSLYSSFITIWTST